MGRLAGFIAGVGGIGRFPIAPGTAGSLAGLVMGLREFPQPFAVLSLLGVWLIGVAASGRVEQDLAVHPHTNIFGVGVHDPPCVVIDEFTGMWTVLLATPQARHLPWLWALAFGLFRLFDIIKPPPLKWLAKAPGGWGIMLDDVGAAWYTVLILWIVMRIPGLVHSP